MNQVLTELKGEIDYIIVGDFNTTYSTISKTAKKKKSVKTDDLNNTIN